GRWPPPAPGRAPPARPEPRPLGGLRDVVELDLIGAGPARGARRPAIDPGRLHGIDEGAVIPAVPGQDDLPGVRGPERKSGGCHGVKLVAGAGTYYPILTSKSADLASPRIPPGGGECEQSWE